MSDSRLKPSLLIGHIQNSEGLAVRTKQVRCTLCPGERALPLCLFILESSVKELYGELSIKGPKLTLLSCPCANTRHGGGVGTQVS